MKTIDFSKEFRQLYSAKKKIEEVEGPRGVYLCVADQGEPGGDTFIQAIQALYAVAYTLRFKLKAERVVDFKVPKLECLWDVTDPKATPRDEWKWRLILRVPDLVTNAHVREAKRIVKERKGLDVSKVSRRSWKEGKALQVMHVGPYDELHRSYDAVLQEADRLGFRIRGAGHEVYLNDPGRVPATKLKTIVRMGISHPRPDYARGTARV